MKKGYEIQDFCKRSVNNILNRSGYSLKKVQKVVPLKKIPQTDAIFENVAVKHTLAKENPRILRISIDTKAKVKVGNLSRNGYSRLQEAPKAHDHDHKWNAQLVPFGVYEINTSDVYIIFGNSCETPDFIIDALEKWWDDRQFQSSEQQYDMLMIDLDNGSSVASATKQFNKRIIELARKINLPIQLVYYPPYHSKYNAVERVWAALENYWKPLILDSVDKVIEVATRMTWKGANPIVSFIDKDYPKGVKVSSDDVNELNTFTIRNPLLPAWDVLILNTLTG